MTMMCALLWLAAAPATSHDAALHERFEGSTSGSVRGGVRFVADVVGYGGLVLENRSSASFDGRPESSIVFGPAARTGSGDFTVEAFIKPAGNWDYAAIAGEWNEDGDRRGWALVLCAGNGLRFDVSPDGKFHGENALFTPKRVAREDAWTHVAAVSRGDVSRVYVNGRLCAERRRGVAGRFAPDGVPITIGNAPRYAEKARPFAGLIDEVRITRRALAPEEFLATREQMPEVKGPVPEKYEMPFTASTAEQAKAWQVAARRRLLELVAARTPRRSIEERPIDFRTEPAEDRGEFTFARASFTGNDGERRPCLWTVPKAAGPLKGTGPFPAVLCLHGHGGSAEAVHDPRPPYCGLADRFARTGYATLAPSFPHRTFAAETLWDLLRCVDILATRPEVDPRRLAVMGLSMGGEWTMWVAACDERITAAVVSGWMCTTEGVFAVFNCPCWELPGFVELMDVCEVNLLIAPRAVLFESAESDPCFLLPYTRQGFARIRAGYAVFGAEDACAQDVFPGGHKVHGERAYPFIDRALGPGGARPARR